MITLSFLSIFTIGILESTGTISGSVEIRSPEYISREEFVELLKDNGIKILVDVRSNPYSKFSPQFNCSEIKDLLKKAGIEYRYLGDLLGGRPKDKSCYTAGKVCYEKIREKGWYKKGIEGLIEIASQDKTVIMCSEEEPYHCHRHLLITPSLLEKEIEVFHIRRNDVMENVKEVQTQPLLFTSV